MKGMTKQVETVIDEIAQERYRQINEEGFTAEHDDAHHDLGDCATAASAYAINAACLLNPFNGTAIEFEELPMTWPFDRSWWKPTTERRDLVKAAALIVAEIERIDREASRNRLAPKRIVKIIGAADGTKTPHDGRFLKAWNPHTEFGVLAVESTDKEGEALHFDSVASVFDDWQATSSVQANRPTDGQPNRPLTAITIEIAPARGADQ